MRVFKRIVPIVAVLLFASPVFAQTDAISQITALLAQIKALQEQITRLQSQAGIATSCVDLSYNLYADQSDDTTNGDVSKLQKFLAQDSTIYPGALITGYFGPMTESAVQRWQAKHGVIGSGSPDSTGFGYVGPKTRAAMSCRGNSNQTSGQTSSQTPITPTPIWTTPPSTSGTPAVPATQDLAPTVRLTAPNGRTYVAGSGESLIISWIGINVPSGSKVCAYLVRVSDGHGFAWPPENTCVSAVSGSGSVAGRLIRTGGYDLGPGTYTVKISLYGPASNSGGKDTPALSTDTSVTPIQLVEKPAVNTAPPQTNPVVINSFNASQSSVPLGQPVTFTWNSNLSTTDISYYGGFCNISAITSDSSQIHVGNSGSASGSVNFTPSLTATYTLNCSSGGKDGSPSVSKQVTVSVQSVSITPAKNPTLAVVSPTSNTPWILNDPSGVSTKQVQIEAHNLPKYPGLWFTLVDTHTGATVPLGMGNHGLGASLVEGSNTININDLPNSGWGSMPFDDSAPKYKISVALFSFPYDEGGPYVSGCIPNPYPKFEGACGSDQARGKLVASAESPLFVISEDMSPKKNAMSCSAPPKINQPAGALACYGLWDFGDAFGNDQNMCNGETGSTPRTGCQVATVACSSGSATAWRVLDTYAPWHNSNATLASTQELYDLATNLQSTVGTLKTQLIRVWEYTCN